MKNNQGYYSWIHSLKAASMESHFKGKKMLQEAKEMKLGFKPEEMQKAHQELMTQTDGPGRPPKGPHINPEYPGDVSKTPHEIYQEIRAQKDSKSKDAAPTDQDVDGSGKPGTANDVAADFVDMEKDDNAILDPSLMKPSSVLAQKAREEHEKALEAEEYEDEERDRQMTIDAQIDRMMGR